MKKFDWILFDADHTLLDFDKSSKVALEAELEVEGVVINNGHYEQYYEINKQCWRRFEDGEIDRLTLRRSRFQLFFEAVGITHIDPDDFSVKYLSRLPQLPYLLDGALELLESLRGEYHLGIVTNGLKEVQRPRFAVSGIDVFFRVIVISGEIGFAKPDAAYFRHTHQRMECPERGRVLVVGDNLNSDIRGAQNFGFKGCWYNPAGHPNEENLRPDYQISALSEVHEVLCHQ